jgi:hypothetical protein
MKSVAVLLAAVVSLQASGLNADDVILITAAPEL